MERPLAGLGVFIVKGGKVLLGQRRNSHGAGSWSFPGGHLELWESFEDCARREVLEETGLSVKNICFVTATNDFYPDEKKHYVNIVMRAEYESGILHIMEPEKITGWEWFSFDALPSPLFISTQNFLHTLKLFRHYKGGLYMLQGEAEHSETKEMVILYKGLESGQVWVRPKEMFYGSLVVEGKTVQRFTPVVQWS